MHNLPDRYWYDPSSNDTSAYVSNESIIEEPNIQGGVGMFWYMIQVLELDKVIEE